MIVFFTILFQFTPAFSQNDAFKIENDYLSIILSAKNGAIQSIYNKKKGLELISQKQELPPWALNLERQSIINDCESFNFNKIPGEADEVLYRLEWIVRGLPIQIKCSVKVEKDKPDIEFYIHIINRTMQKIFSISFPIIRGITELGDKTRDDFLVHPSGGGLLVKNPMSTFNPGNPQDYKTKFANSEYPDGYHGSPMQFIGYFDEDSGGFYFATHDPYSTCKEINFYKDFNENSLYIEFIHKNWDSSRHNASEISLDYPIVIGVLNRGDWYEGAERYRSWVEGKMGNPPPWAKNAWDLNIQDKKARDWLKEDVGLCTFGISSRRNQTRLLRELGKSFDTPIFHITAFDWENNDTSNTDWGNDDLKVCFFNKNNLKVIRRNGDYFALYKNDCFISKKCEEYFNSFGKSGTEIFFEDRNNISEYMCPYDEAWVEFYAARDVFMTSSDGPKSDGIYNDISLCNAAPLVCNNILHTHPQEIGRGMIEAYRNLIFSSKKACMEKNQTRYIPFGTELIIENLVDLIDFYQARGFAEVQGFFEWNGDITGMIEKIPLFTYVYHEMGPVRLDGFLKLSKEFGDIFYYIAAKVIFWGGIPELDFEFSSSELFEGMTGSTYYVTYDYWTNWIEDKSPYKVDPDKVSFLR
ncbi:hypothetical protein KKB18_13200, partial [bacterium]|nr:hypothetical protein [bacterium]